MKPRIAVAGLGKMGISHLAIAKAHPEAELVAVCDSAGYLLAVVDKYTDVRVFSNYSDMLHKAELDGVIIATPSHLHAPMVRQALEQGLHVFCEKPFCLDTDEGRRLADLARNKGLVNQVGYHYRFVATFQEAKRLLDRGALGPVTHALAEAYGPVVLRPQVLTWRTSRAKGGGCLYDYAAHPLNLLNWLFGAPISARGSAMPSIFSKEIEDSVYSTLLFESGVHAQVSVNWSDESFRKMSTKLTVYGENGRLSVDRQELQLYLRNADRAGGDYNSGWNVRNTTDLTEPTWFYLRGEEYSAQIDQFIKNVIGPQPDSIEADFASAVATDETMAMISADALRDDQGARAPRRDVERRTGLIPRLLGTTERSSR